MAPSLDGVNDDQSDNERADDSDRGAGSNPPRKDNGREDHCGTGGDPEKRTGDPELNTAGDISCEEIDWFLVGRDLQQLIPRRFADEMVNR